MAAIERAARLSVRGLVHRFGDRTVLDGLDFDVRRGEVFGLLGPNGSGKSTTFGVLTGMLVPAACELRLDGAPIAPGDRRLRSRLGIVFQAPSLDPRMTARENLRLGAALYGVRGPTARDRIEALLDLVELRDRGDEPVRRLSGGMRRRLELVRALVHGPQILVLDEPTTGLDETSFRRAWARIIDLRDREGLTVLVTTHRHEEAEQCDRIAILDGGRAVADGTPAELKQRVSGDVLLLEGDAPEELAREITERFAVGARVVDGQVVVERERGHELVPRIVEAFPPGRLHSVAMRRPTLADAFLKLTGRTLGGLDRARGKA